MRLAALLLVLVFAGACAHTTPVAGAVDATLPPSDETQIQVAALGELSRGLAPNDTLWVQERTRPLFDDTTAADRWVDEQRTTMNRVPPALLTAYAHANIDGGDVALPRVIRNRPVAAPRIAPALATRAMQIFTVTRPGFDATGDSAFVMVTRACGAQCGRTDGFLVVRDRGSRWRVAATLWRIVR